jgi:hypothetical protein
MIMNTTLPTQTEETEAATNAAVAEQWNVESATEMVKWNVESAMETEKTLVESATGMVM